MLTRTSRGLRAVRTGYSYWPPACCAYRRLRAACPGGGLLYVRRTRTNLGRAVKYRVVHHRHCRAASHPNPNPDPDPNPNAGGRSRGSKAAGRVRRHGQSGCPFGRAPARLLRLLRARLVALGGVHSQGERPAHRAPSRRLGCLASRLQSRRFLTAFGRPGAAAAAEQERLYADRASPR